MARQTSEFYQNTVAFGWNSINIFPDTRLHIVNHPFFSKKKRKHYFSQVFQSLPLPCYNCQGKKMESTSASWLRNRVNWRFSTYHGWIDFTGIHIHSADIVEGVYISFLEKKKERNGIIHAPRIALTYNKCSRLPYGYLSFDRGVETSQNFLMAHE